MFLFGVVLVGAAVASQIRFDYLAQSGFYWALVMFSAASTLSAKKENTPTIPAPICPSLSVRFIV